VSQEKNQTSPKMVSLRKLSEMYGIPLYTLRTWSSYRYIPCLKLGKKIYVKIDEFEKWLDKNTENYSFQGKWKFKCIEEDAMRINDMSFQELIEKGVAKYLKQNGLHHSEEQVSLLSNRLKYALKILTKNS